MQALFELLRRSLCGRRIVLLLFFVFVMQSVICEPNAPERADSQSIKFDDAGGSGKYPYNSRIIDGRLLAGGYLFNPVNKSNSPEKVREFLRLLRELGASSLILLHVPLNDVFTDQLQKLCDEEQIELFKLRMNDHEVPDEEQFKKTLELIKAGTYVHCMWGCDRTGAIIAKYLRHMHAYTGRHAFDAVVFGGTHAGPLGGFKKAPGNRNLLLYFWPEVAEEAPEIFKLYN